MFAREHSGYEAPVIGSADQAERLQRLQERLDLLRLGTVEAPGQVAGRGRAACCRERALHGLDALGPRRRPGLPGDFCGGVFRGYVAEGEHSMLMRGAVSRNFARCNPTNRYG